MLVDAGEALQRLQQHAGGGDELDEVADVGGARERLAEWKDKKNWKSVWTWDSDKRQPWPIFVRIGGLAVLIGVAPSAAPRYDVSLDALTLADNLPVALPSEYKIHEGSIVFRTYRVTFTEEDLRTGIAQAEYRGARITPVWCPPRI